MLYLTIFHQEACVTWASASQIVIVDVKQDRDIPRGEDHFQHGWQLSRAVGGRTGGFPFLFWRRCFHDAQQRPRQVSKHNGFVVRCFPRCTIHDIIERPCTLLFLFVQMFLPSIPRFNPQNITFYFITLVCLNVTILLDIQKLIFGH